MPIKSTTNFAVLGLLAIKPMSAYELVKFSKETIGFFWNESYGNIHRTLKMLANGGSIELLEKSNSGREKKTYAITAKGSQHLKEWLLKPPDEIILRDELLLKLFISEKEDISKVLPFIQQELQEMTQAISVFDEIQEGIAMVDQDPTRKAFWLLSLDYGKRYAQTRMLWCQQTIISLSAIERNENS